MELDDELAVVAGLDDVVGVVVAPAAAVVDVADDELVLLLLPHPATATMPAAPRASARHATVLRVTFDTKLPFRSI
jgi:hypothetical protein